MCIQLCEYICFVILLMGKKLIKDRCAIPPMPYGKKLLDERYNPECVIIACYTMGYIAHF